MTALAMMYMSQGRNDTAGPLIREALAIQRRTLGKDHPQTLDSMTMLADLHRDEARYRAAEPLYLEALDGHRRNYGDQHPITLTYGLATLRLMQARYDEAESPLLEILEAGSAELDQNNLSAQSPQSITGITMMMAEVQLALVHIYDDQYDAAETRLRGRLEEQRRLFGEDHPILCPTLVGLAKFHIARGELADAERLNRKASSMAVMFYGEDNQHIPYWKAGYSARIGDRVAAFRFLRQAVGRGFLNPDVMLRDRDLQSLHGDPEFETIVAEVKERVRER